MEMLENARVSLDAKEPAPSAYRIDDLPIDPALMTESSKAVGLTGVESSYPIGELSTASEIDAIWDGSPSKRKISGVLRLGQGATPCRKTKTLVARSNIFTQSREVYQKQLIGNGHESYITRDWQGQSH